VAVTHIVGPGAMPPPSEIANINPSTADKNPMNPDSMMTFFNLLDNNRAVEAGVINIATTKITPTARSEETTANESSSIRK